MLTTLGLDSTAESVYRTMLGHPRHGVAELARDLALSPDRVREALDLLSELALIRPSNEGDVQLRAISPDLGMEILLARQQAELAAQQLRLESSRATAAQLIAEYSDLRPVTTTPGVEQLVGIDRIRDRLTSLSRQVTTEVMTLAPDGAHTEDSMRAARETNRDVLARGVTMRTVYLDSLRNSPTTRTWVDWLTEHGGHVRTTATLPTRLIIQDRSIAVIPVSSDDTAAGAVVLTGQGTVTALIALFESIWAPPYPSARRPHRHPGLNAQEAAVLQLLADGHTDDAIAKRLGVSPRTGRRIATDLIERLGARSRFQAGAEAAHKGWLQPGTRTAGH
ncbi:helix-turn-helix transcriptional regulator [Streptacidiphilus sp. 4-A2]|nr:helix-turn-helix transcriptional regulator [Streptacidiphilus sp. 4-A2]